MQDPTPLIKDLLDQLEHADDILEETQGACVRSATDAARDQLEHDERSAVIARANAYLTALHNADLFATEHAT